jgi:hypothetical protein
LGKLAKAKDLVVAVTDAEAGTGLKGVDHGRLT